MTWQSSSSIRTLLRSASASRKCRGTASGPLAASSWRSSPRKRRDSASSTKMRIDSGEPATPTDQTPASPSAREPATRRILIADDQADERAIQRALLHHLGYD